MPLPENHFSDEKWERRFAAAKEKLNLAALEADTRPAFSLRVVHVLAVSEAAAKGVKEGDLITAVNGVQVRGIDGMFLRRIGRQEPVDVWSPSEGLRRIRFDDMTMGVCYEEHWLPELSYTRSKDRDSAWDTMVLVACRTWQKDARLAETALHHAYKAGYRGWLLPALMVAMTTETGRADLALAYGYSAYRNMPEEAIRPVIGRLCQSALREMRFEFAQALDDSYPGYYLQSVSWDPAPVRKRHNALSRKERGLIHSSPEGLRTIETYLTANAEAFCENADTIRPALRKGEPFLILADPGNYTYVAFGPFTRNPALIVDFRMYAPESSDPADSPRFEVSLADAEGCIEDHRVQMTCDVQGRVKVSVEGYHPFVLISEDLARLNGVNRAEIYINGPWCGVWLNHRRLFTGLAPRHTQRMFPALWSTEMKVNVSKVAYGELEPVLANVQPTAQADGPGTAAPNLGEAADEPQVPEKPDDAALAWLYDVTVESYLNHGSRSPTWDKDALEAVWLAGRYWGPDPNYVEPHEVLLPCRRAIEKGCADPLVMLVYAEFLRTLDGINWPEADRAHAEAATLMPASAYHPLLKFWALNRSIGNRTSSRLKPNSRRGETESNAAAALIPEILNDSRVPQSLLRRVVLEVALQRYSPYPARMAEFQRYYKALAEGDPDSSLALAYKGGFYTDYAWDARGSGWADTVTPEGGKLFRERLAVAAECLTKACAADPSNSEAMIRMIEVAAGQDLPRSDMEAWFNAAVRANPDCLAAYEVKLWYLQPRWHGSSEEMVAFGGQCVMKVLQNPEIEPGIATIIAKAHDYVVQELRDQSENAHDSITLEPWYWSRLGVWQTVQLGYSLILKRRPFSRLYKSEYAHYAVECQQWETANRLFRELGDELAAAPFGGAGQAFAAKRKARDAVRLIFRTSTDDAALE